MTVFSTGMSFLASCELDTTVSNQITSTYLQNQVLDTYIDNEQIVRLKGKPGVTSIEIGKENLSKYKNCFVLYVANGTTQATAVSSAIIKLDGLEVLNTSDFSKNSGQFTFEVCNLTPASILTVEVRGEPGSYVNVWIEGKLKELTVSDCDGNIYKTVQIGEQIWMKENLKTTKYNDCTPIPYVTDNTEWYNQSTPSYAFYNFDEATYKESYGALYKYYTIGTGKLCPTGWHVPSQPEFEELVNYLGGNEAAYSKLLKGGSSGFDAMFGGMRDYPGNFVTIDNSDIYWLSTYHAFVALHNFVLPLQVNFYYWEDPISNNRAFSVRCLKDQ